MEAMIRVRLVLLGYLHQLAAEKTGGRDWISVPTGTTAGGMAETLGVTGYHLGLIGVNGVAVQHDWVLGDGDEVKISPIVGGG